MSYTTTSTIQKQKITDTNAKKRSEYLIQLAEDLLKSPETRHFISLAGLERVRRRITA